MIRFTKDEKIVILFLLVAFLVGSAALYYKRINPRPVDIIQLSADETSKSQRVNPALSASENFSVARKGRVNINTAGKDELVKLK